jgi:hypothetical protein
LAKPGQRAFSFLQIRFRTPNFVEKKLPLSFILAFLVPFTFPARGKDNFKPLLLWQSDRRHSTLPFPVFFFCKTKNQYSRTPILNFCKPQQ